MERVGDYEIKRELARGNMGVVYQAIDPGLGRDVAVKLIRRSLSKSRTLRERFRREAQALARLHHPNVLRVHAFGDHDGQPFIVMELLDGESLQTRLEREGQLIDEREAVEITMALAQALIAAHEHGLLHRDVKPDNVILATDGPRLTDFGLARDQEASGGLTRDGVGLGTPGYWPPEQATGDLQRIGPPSDVYGVGATLYAMLAGRPPVSARTAPEVLAALKTRPDPLSKSRGGVDPRLEAICGKCLEPDPKLRYPTMQALADDLKRYLAGAKVEASATDVRGRLENWFDRNRPAALAGVIGACVVLCVLAVGLSMAQPSGVPTESPPPEPEVAQQAAPREEPEPAPAAAPRPLSPVAQRAWELAREKARAGRHDVALEQYRFLLGEAEERRQRKRLVEETAAVLVARGTARAEGMYEIPKASLADFDEAVRMAPRSAEVHVAIGRVHWERARRSLDSGPREGELAKMHERRTQRLFGPARDHLQRATALDPLSGEGWQLLGSTLHFLGDHRGAVRALERSRPLTDDDAETLLYLGSSRRRIGKVDRAVTDLTLAKAACGEIRGRARAALLGRILLERAEALLSRRRKGEAREDCLRVLDMFEGTTNLGTRAQRLLERAER